MRKKVKAVGQRRLIRPSSYEGWSRWSCLETAQGCEVRAYMDSTGLWQTIAGISGSKETVLDIAQMVELLNRQKRTPEDIRTAFAALRALEEEGLTFATEMELEHITERLEKGGTRAD